MNKRTLCLALIIACLHTTVHAQAFKCKEANGRYTYQNIPCPADAGSPERKRPTLKELNESSAQQKKDDRPGANWEPRALNSQNARSSPQRSEPASSNQATVASPAAAGRASWQEKEQEYQRRRLEEQSKEIAAYNEKVKASNQMQRCNQARQQLDVARKNRPVYSLDNSGDRHYVKDDDRAGVISGAEQRVAEACR